jgi:hypothetical protein
LPDDLGPKPDPAVQPKEPNPGGVDAIDADDGPPAVPDLDPQANPATEDRTPEEIRRPDGTEAEATTDGASEPTKESPA